MLDSYDSFKTVVDKYPDSKYAPDSAQRMRYIINALAAHEVYSATYYYKRGAYLAAINRAQAAIQQYKNSPATEDALHVMVIFVPGARQQAIGRRYAARACGNLPDSPYVTGRARPGSAAEKPWWQIW
ncbi:MAG: outer membrane protein assembly factor BamD [Pararobbsia sp.]